MGSGFGFKCSCCGYEYDVCTGIGMLFPQEYKKLLSDIKQGKYGTEWKTQKYKCFQCFERRIKGIKTVEEWGEVPYVTSWEDYHLLRFYAHKCERCSCSMRKGLESEMLSLPCPKCGSEPDPEHLNMINWD